MKKKFFLGLGLVILAYLLWYPVRIEPEKYSTLPIPELKDDYDANNVLSSTEIKYKGKCPECEDIAMAPNGVLYGAAVDGRIIQMKDGKASTFATTGGRPLGMHFDSLQNLIVCDAQEGLLSIDPNGKITVLATEHDNLPFLFTDDVDISKNGIIYFSDASSKFNFKKYKLDFIEHGANGRLLTYNPQSKETTLLLDNLYFANGVALSEDETFVLVNETSQNQVRRYWLDGNKAGSSDIFIENLPFYPDGISLGENGIFWIAMQSPRKKILEILSDKPFIRKMIVRIPPFLMPKPTNYSYVLGVNHNGEIVYNLQDPKAKWAQITSIEQVGNQLYFGSLSENGVGKFTLDF